MSVNWLWKHEMGYRIQVQKHTYKSGVDIFGNDVLKTETKKFKIKMYAGSNCLAVFTWEFKEDSVDENGKHKMRNMYRMVGFWCDKKHMENMLGLHPKDGYGDNCYSEAENPENYVELLVLNTYYKQECKEILSRAQEFTKAGIKIKLFYKEPKWAKKGK